MVSLSKHEARAYWIPAFAGMTWWKMTLFNLDTRSVVRIGGEGAKKFWADAARPEENDETLGNWMSKLDRLRPTEFVSAPPAGREPVVRLEYAAGSRALGFVEVVKTKATEAGKSDYYLQTERTRLFAKVSASLGEQLEQDLGSAVK